MKRLAPLAALLFSSRCCPTRPCPPGAPSRVEVPRPPPPAPPADPVASYSAWPTYSLRWLPKADRWARARADLAIFADQEARLREAVVERDRMLEGKWGIVTRLLEGLPPTTAMGDEDEFLGLVDSEALRAADAAFRARVEGILSAEQLRLWDTLGYEGAFGRRLPIPPPPSLVSGLRFRASPPPSIGRPSLDGLPSRP